MLPLYKVARKPKGQNDNIISPADNFSIYLQFRVLVVFRDLPYEVFHVMKFMKTTVLGGILFLFPIVIFAAVIGKAMQLVDRLATPLANVAPIESIGGLAVVHLVAAVIVILICFIAGLAAKTPTARGLVDSLEANVLDKIPAYALLKAKSGSILTPEDTGAMQPVLIRFDDSWQVGFEVERMPDGKSLVFLPGAPDPWSGSVCAVTGDRLQQLPINIKEVNALMKRLGRGSSEVLRTTLASEKG